MNINNKRTNARKLLILSMIIAASFATKSVYSQVHVNVGIGVPAPVVVYENDYPGYTYYTYPAWQGHYRDRVYYAHYRPIFERDHRAYFHGRSFDHARYERESHWHGGHTAYRAPVRRPVHRAPVHHSASRGGHNGSYHRH